MPIKLIILGVFVVGVTIGSVVASQSGGGSGGCDMLASVAGEQSDSAAEASDDNGGTSSDSSGGSDSGGSDAGGDEKTDTGDDGTSGGGSDSDGGSSDDGGTDTPDDDGGDQSNNNGNNNGSGDADDDDNGNDNTNDNTNNNGGGGSIALVGEFDGNLTVVTVESLGEDGGGPERTTTLAESITFDATGRPEEITIFGYAGTPNQRTVARQIGEEETITDSTSANGTQTEITLVVRVTEALYTSTNFRIRYALTFNSQGGSLRRSGTGSQLVIGSIDAAGKLSYSVETNYTVRLTAGSIVFNTTNDIDADGLLSRDTTAGQNN